MKKLMIRMSLVLLVALPLGLWGCGSDDPVDPPSESCSITVTSPVAGAGYFPGNPDHEMVPIRWDETGDAASVTIALLKDGTLQGTIVEGFANSGFYSWTASNLGGANGSDFAIRVTADGQDNCLGISPLFSLTNTVGCDLAFTNEFPETALAGTTLDLTWDSHNTTGQVDIQLWLQGVLDSNLGLVAQGIDDDGAFSWTVDSLHNGTSAFYYLRIKDSDLDECAGASEVFGIFDDDICTINVVTPAGGAVWEVDEVRTITLVPSNEVTTVDLRLYTGNIALGTIVANLDVTDPNYQWTVRNFDNTGPATMYRVRAINVDDTNCVGESGLFTINP